MFLCTVNIVFEYIKYRWNARGRHGTHSPFVYDFVDKCLKMQVDDNFKLSRKKIFAQLARSRKTIEVTDFGAGSKKLGSTRKISAIFNTSSSKGKYGDLLYKIAAYYRPKNSLELGTSLGVGTIHIAAGNPLGQVETIEGSLTTFHEANDNFRSLGLKNIVAHHANFTDFLTHNTQSFDLIFIDGHHEGEALLTYIHSIYPFLEDDSLLLLDDIRWSESMLHAWKKICGDERFHLSMDLFRMGIVAKRHSQAKQHFVIKM